MYLNIFFSHSLPLIYLLSLSLSHTHTQSLYPHLICRLCAIGLVLLALNVLLMRYAFGKNPRTIGDIGDDSEYEALPSEGFSLRNVRMAIANFPAEFWLLCAFSFCTIGTLWPFIALSPDLWNSKWGRERELERERLCLLSLTHFRQHNLCYLHL